MLLQKLLSRKKLSREKLSIFVSKIGPATGVKTDRFFATFSDLLGAGAVRKYALPKDGRKEGGRGRNTRQWVNEAKN